MPRCMRKADRAKLLCGEIPGGDIKNAEYDHRTYFLRNNAEHIYPYHRQYERSAADKIKRGFGRNEGALGEDRQAPDRTPETPVKA